MNYVINVTVRFLLRSHYFRAVLIEIYKLSLFDINSNFYNRSL